MCMSRSIREHKAHLHDLSAFSISEDLRRSSPRSRLVGLKGRQRLKALQSNTRATDRLSVQMPVQRKGLRRTLISGLNNRHLQFSVSRLNRKTNVVPSSRIC